MKPIRVKKIEKNVFKIKKKPERAERRKIDKKRKIVKNYLVESGITENSDLENNIIKLKEKAKIEKKKHGLSRPYLKKAEELEEKSETLKAVKEYFDSIRPNIQIDLKKILASKKYFNIVLTATQLGKSLGFGMWVCEEILKDSDKVFVWIRRHEKEVQNTVVSMFRTLLGGVEKVRITMRGVDLDGRQVVYFVPLNVYYNYKSLTGLASKLKAVIFDEAIPLNKRYLDDNYTSEEEKFTQLINILARKDISKEKYKEAPVYFLCNPNAKGAWIIQKWFPNYKPSENREKVESKGEAFIYSKPWPKEQSRGIVDKLETSKEQLVSKFGVYSATEDMFIINLKPTSYIVSFVLLGKEMEFGRRGETFIIDIPNRQKDKKLVVFSRGDLLLYENALLVDRRWYYEWWYNLIAQRKLFFTNHSLRDSFISTTQRNWANVVGW